MQQALALGLIGFVVGKIAATLSAPVFPKYVLLIPFDSIVGFLALLLICILASVVAIRMALKVDPAERVVALSDPKMLEAPFCVWYLAAPRRGSISRS